MLKAIRGAQAKQVAKAEAQVLTGRIRRGIVARSQLSLEDVRVPKCMHPARR